MSRLFKLYVITGVVLNLIVSYNTKTFNTQSAIYLLLAGPLGIVCGILVGIMELVRVLVY